MSRFRRFLCALRGHDSVLHFEARRVMLRCVSCGHDSPGWLVVGRGPIRRYDADPAKVARSGLRLVVARRTA